MFYRLNKKINTWQLDRAIAGILDTPPIELKDAPWCIVSMVAKGDLLTYLLALKSFYPVLGGGKVAAIIDRDTPQTIRETLTQHVPGLEFVILEDIPTDPCQRGGTWERLLYVLDRSEREYTIQLDADTLTVAPDLEEVVQCVKTNRPFTMSDGFELLPFPEVAEEADATPSNYIGIVAERMFARYPDAPMRYVRGSSGFAGFSHGGFTRAQMTRFHIEMERLVGAKRWREWGTEQVGSNFAIANSPDAVVLPYPEYTSFTPHAARNHAKFFHFIGAWRFLDAYYAARAQEVIEKLAPGSARPRRPKQKDLRGDSLPLAFARRLEPSSAVRYFAWCLGRSRGNVWLRLRSEKEFPGPELQLRPKSTGNNDFEAAYQIFVNRSLHTPVRIPPERVKLIVDLGANVEMSCLYWLAAYWRAEVLAFEENPAYAAQCRTTLERNGYLPRVSLHSVPAGTRFDILPLLAGRRIDILKLDIHGSYSKLLEDSGFEELDIRAIVLESQDISDGSRGQAWCTERLQKLGFEPYSKFEKKRGGTIWAYRKRAAAALRAPSTTASLYRPTQELSGHRS